MASFISPVQLLLSSSVGENTLDCVLYQHCLHIQPFANRLPQPSRDTDTVLFERLCESFSTQTNYKNSV